MAENMILRSLQLVEQENVFTVNRKSDCKPTHHLWMREDMNWLRLENRIRELL